MKILKFIGAAILGMTIGLLIAIPCILLFTDTTLQEFLNKLISTNIVELIGAVAVGIAALFVAIAILIPAHEAGHLIFGLLSGYKFVSFRIFNYTFIKENDKIRIKKFAIAGTGGQCLLTPPERPFNEVPTVLYNLGGIIANFVVLVALLPVLWMDIHPYLREFVLIIILIDAIIMLMNGVPMKINGVGNDGHNTIELLKSPESKRGLIYQLRSNALIQNGVRPKDMPEELFTVPENIDYTNAMEVAMPMMAASRLIDEMRFEEALDAFEQLYEKRDKIIPLYVNEIACETAYLQLVTGRTAEAETILDKNLRQYIETYRKFMSSKERLHFAITLYLDKDTGKAIEIFENLKSRRNDYLLRGEVISDIAIMEQNLSNHVI